MIGAGGLFGARCPEGSRTLGFGVFQCLPDDARCSEVFNGHADGFEQNASGAWDGVAPWAGEDFADFSIDFGTGETDVAGLALNARTRLGNDGAGVHYVVIEFAERVACGSDSEYEGVG